jgi:hypothetical protein
MSPPEQSVELVSTKDIEMFIPILRAIDFGDQFLLSMLIGAESVNARPL